MRYEEYIRKVIDDYSSGPQSDATDFPEFELYMDQALTYMNRKLAVFGKGGRDPVLTRTMINNYTKHRMLPAPVNKKYNQTHLILLTLICHLKKSFQMDEIEKLMKPLIDNYQSDFDEKIDFMQIFQGIADVSEQDRQTLNAAVRSDIERIKSALNRTEIGDDDMLEVFMLVMTLAIRANTQRLLAERLLDEYFIKPSAQRAKKVKRPKIKFDSQGDVLPRRKGRGKASAK